MKIPENIDEYIKAASPEVRKILKKMRSIIRKSAPQAKEKIAWGMPTYHLEGNLVHFAAFKKHISLFPGSEPIRHFKKELLDYKTSKGTIQIPYDAAIPVALVSKIVKFCVRLNLVSAEAKKRMKALKKR